MARHEQFPLPTTAAEHAAVGFALDRAFNSIGFARDVIAFDKLTMRRFDQDGRMHVDLCNISKANVCPYFGREIPNYRALGLDANRVYNLYRDPAELEAAAPSFNNLQLLMVHTVVNAKDPKTEVTVGTIGSDAAFIAPYLKASLCVWTAEGIKLIETEQQAQLSCSYRYRADMTPGTTPEGVAFDGVMRDIMGNHVALVEKGRAGSDVVVSDSQPSELQKMHRPHLVARIVAAGLFGSTPTDEQKLALDTALASSTAADCGAEDGMTDEERKAKAAKDGVVSLGPKDGLKGAALTAADVALAVDTAIAAGGFVSKTDAAKLASDAANAAVARVNALHKARKDVEPLVGVVAMDSAEEVYAFALKQAQVATDGVPAAAYGALVEQVKVAKIAGTRAKLDHTPKFAADAASAVQGAIPGLGRFGVAH